MGRKRRCLISLIVAAAVVLPTALWLYQKYGWHGLEFRVWVGRDLRPKPRVVPGAGSSELLAYVDKAIRKLDAVSREKFLKLIREKLPKTPPNDKAWRTDPWFVWQIDTRQGEKRFVVFGGQHLCSIPGESHGSIHVFDEHGTLLSASEFSTGWRIDLLSATCTEKNPLDEPMIEVRSSAVINGRDVRRQFYGFVGDRAATLRLEDSGYHLLRNIYYAPNHTIGPPPPRRTAEEWEAALRSENPCEVLEALVWLGGVHWDLSRKPEPDVYHETAQEAGLFKAVHEREGVRKRLSELAHSEIEWVRQAAVLAQTPKYEW